MLFFLGIENINQIHSDCYTDTDVILLLSAVDNPDSLRDIGEIWVPEIRHSFPKGTTISTK